MTCILAPTAAPGEWAMKPPWRPLTGAGPDATFVLSSGRHHGIPLGQVAQVVEQRPEKPCVDGSNPSLATALRPRSALGTGAFFVQGLPATDKPATDRRTAEKSRLLIVRPRAFGASETPGRHEETSSTGGRPFGPRSRRV